MTIAKQHENTVAPDYQGQDQIFSDGTKVLKDTSSVFTSTIGVGRAGYTAEKFAIVNAVNESSRRRTVQRDPADNFRPFVGPAQPLQVTYRRHHIPFGSLQAERGAKGDDHVIETSLVSDWGRLMERPNSVHGLNRSTLIWGVPCGNNRGVRPDESNQNPRIPFGRMQDQWLVASVSGNGDWMTAHNLTPPDDEKAFTLSAGRNSITIPYSPTTHPATAGSISLRTEVIACLPTMMGGWTMDIRRDLVGNWSMITEHVIAKTAEFEKNKDGQSVTILAVRNDAQFVMGEKHGRIYFTGEKTGVEGDSVQKILGEMVSDSDLANFNTALNHETVEWRPEFTLPISFTYTPEFGQGLDIPSDQDLTFTGAGTGDIVGEDGLTLVSGTGGHAIASSGDVSVSSTGTVDVAALGGPVDISGDEGVNLDAIDGDINLDTSTTNSVNVFGGTAYGSTTPSEITSDQNDYAISTAKNQRLSTDAERTITGFASNHDDGNDAGFADNTGAGMYHTIENVGSNNIILADQDTGSAAANRIITGTGADITIPPSGSVDMQYDNTTDRWRVIGQYP